MTASARGEAELVAWFMELWAERKWNQELAGKLLGMSQRHMSTWKTEWKAAAEENRAIQLGTYSDGSARLKALRAMVDEYGIEIAEIPPEQKDLVNQLLDFVTHSDTFAPGVSPSDRRKFAENLMGTHNYTGPMKAYFAHRFNRWRGVP